MEQPGIEIRSVQLRDESIILTYENDAVETLPNNLATYKTFYDVWLKDNPPFISDVHKGMMRNIVLGSINNNEKCLADLKTFFEAPNEEHVKTFLSYMRKRDVILPEKKAIWTNVL
jgi:hypothetical protein